MEQSSHGGSRRLRLSPPARSYPFSSQVSHDTLSWTLNAQWASWLIYEEKVICCEAALNMHSQRATIFLVIIILHTQKKAAMIIMMLVVLQFHFWWLFKCKDATQICLFLQPGHVSSFTSNASVATMDEIFVQTQIDSHMGLLCIQHCQVRLNDHHIKCLVNM